MSASRPSVAVYKFSSCDGCQLQLLNLEDEILDLAQAVEIAYFLEATSAMQPGPYDVALVEGSVTTPHEIERIKGIRRQARLVVALGTCATAGGIQALRNVADSKEYAEVVYPHPEYLDFLATATPISDHIRVDLELWGCPVNKTQVLEVISALLQNRRPNLPQYSVCLECKQRTTVCVLVAQDIPCLGPHTQAGCGGICPSVGRGCYGCFGPTVLGNFDSLVPLLQSMERYPGETRRLLSHVSNCAPAFQAAAERLAGEEN
ncbi:MAG TPA: oxidoreductase [Chloroflexi bacterium]|nr:oxidoreductase [Chloroflexota bacterium]